MIAGVATSLGCLAKIRGGQKPKAQPKRPKIGEKNKTGQRVQITDTLD
jgi:hypothetical protein